MMSDEGRGALKQALLTQVQCAKLGFDWPDVAPVFDKVVEELDEIKAEVNAPQARQSAIEDEVGDLFFAAVNLARHLNVEPERALKNANDKFCQRFSLVEQFAKQDGVELAQASAIELELYWVKAKKVLQADPLDSEYNK